MIFLVECILVLFLLVVMVLVIRNRCRTAVCLITFKPRDIYCEFLNSFTRYRVYVIVDDNDFDLTEFKAKYKNLTFVQIENKKCEDTGYINTCTLILKKAVTGWSKAVYYFSLVNTQYDKVWFMEDDVFFHSEDTLLKIDAKYKGDDLLSNKIEHFNHDGNSKEWHWPKMHINLDPPYHGGMMCCVRFSKKMFKCIDTYAKNNNTLFFLEPMFPTLAIKNNLKYSTPPEFETITVQNDFKEEDINVKGLYHPIKDLNRHVTLREKISSS